MKIFDPSNVNILYDSVLARFEKKKEKKTEDFVKTKEGLFIPNTEKKAPEDHFLIGTVVRVGDGYVNHDGTIQKLRVHEGDNIIIDKRNSANEIIFESTDENYEYRLIRESNILMTINVDNEEQIRKKIIEKEESNESKNDEKSSEKN